MKLSQYAKQKGITYRTAYRIWKDGFLKGEQLPTGTIIVYDEIKNKQELNKNNVILYARVSSSENKSNLDSQLNRLRDYASAKGYVVIKEIKEIGSGLNDKRPKLEKIFQEDNWSKIIVEHKDRLARFGTNYIKVLLNNSNKDIEIINEIDSDKQDLMQDFVSIITSFTARLYGLRRSKIKTEEIIKALQDK